MRVVDLKVLPESAQVLAPVRQATEPAARQAVEEALVRAAAVDGDRVVDRFEADAVRAAFDAARPQGGALTAADVPAFRSALDLRLSALTAARAPATEVLFTSEGQAVSRFRAAILGSIDETLKKAAGRTVDVNVMIFSFTDRALADALLGRAKSNPNLNLRILTDWGQLSESGSRQASRVQRLAHAQGLSNVVVKFKKDAPYVWNAAEGEPQYSHGATQGLNHHKGFVTLIDGHVEKMGLGSFNWSIGAMESNYENLMVLDRSDVDNRPAMASFQAEFEHFWNDDEAALTMAEAQRERERLYAALHEANGVAYAPRPVTAPVIADPPYAAPDTSGIFDVNSFADADAAALQSVVGAEAAAAIHAELRAYGRFDDAAELFARVPALSSLSGEARAKLEAKMELGEGGLSVNTASASELDRAGFSKRQAEAIVARRAQRGPWESVSELTSISGIGPARMAALSHLLNVEEVAAAYSARVPGQPATTGYAPQNRGTWRVLADPASPVDPASATVDIERTLAAPVIDMLRRAAPGDVFRLAMYGISPGSPEFAELKRAVERGVVFRGVLYDAYNGPAIQALLALKQAGHDVDLRVIKSRVMHEKFGVLGDDVFNGSSNFSTSSTGKHSEDRFLFRGQPKLAARFVEEFERLWARGAAP